MEQGFWSAGAIFCVAVAWVFIPCCGWRWFVLICSFPLWMVLCFYWAVPESPRWLITVGRMKEAEAICRNIARINGKDLPSGNLVGKSSTNQERGTSMKDLWLPAYKLTTNLLFISFFCCVLTYYGISFLSEHVFEGKNVYWEMMITTSSEIPGLLIGFCVLDRIGRRNTLTLFYTLFTVCTFLLIFDSIAKNQSAAILLIFIGRLCISSAFYTLYIYFSEFYPTVIRNRALGSASAIGRIAGITTNFIVTNMNISSACSIYFTFGFIGIIVSYTLPIETLGRKMGDSLQINEIEDIAMVMMNLRKPNVNILQDSTNENNNKPSYNFEPIQIDKKKDNCTSEEEQESLNTPHVEENSNNETKLNYSDIIVDPQVESTSSMI